MHENLAGGGDVEAIIAALVEGGVPEPLARVTVLRAKRSPGTRAARAWAQVGQLKAELRSPRVERTRFPSVEAFYQRYWNTNTAVCFEGMAARWPACSKWSPGFFASSFGEAEVEACTGRADDPDPDINAGRHRERMPMARFVERVESAGVSNDVYLIAGGGNSRTETLAPLFEDVAPPEGLFAPRKMRSSSALWFGPAGTITALHHDTSNILFCQIYGRKRLRLAPPDNPQLLQWARGLYSHVDPRDPAPEHAEAAASMFDVVVEPGDALFIPVGWWHHVEALDVSISLALNGFGRDNAFAWYLPGRGAQ
ncbi:MAG: cupin-like domain-containing protein [Nannocystaceae bacterium]|nr:cupin-like domain-containing protein [bacterium]